MVSTRLLGTNLTWSLLIIMREKRSKGNFQYHPCTRIAERDAICDSRDFGRDSLAERVNGNDKNYNGRVIKPVFFSAEEVSALSDRVSALPSSRAPVKLRCNV